jgi:hypothetical protein
MTRLLFALLLAAGAAVAHDQCDTLAPGKGMAHVRVGDADIMCGFVVTPHAGTYRFEANVPGTRVYVAKQLVRGPVALAKDQFEIRVEAPASEDFVLSWDQAVGVMDAIPTFLLYKPVKTVGAPCARF